MLGGVGDQFGGQRPGNNLFSSSLVAVEIKTGKRVWHQQLVHHDIWDYDMPVPPMLFDVVHQGKRIPAVGAMTKNPLLFILDRATGKPIYGVEEKPVAKGDVPGEWYSPTQPFPTKPAAYDRQGVSLDDLIDFTPELKAEGQKLAANYKLGPLFTPPVVSQRPGPLATLALHVHPAGAVTPTEPLPPVAAAFAVVGAIEYEQFGGGGGGVEPEG